MQARRSPPGPVRRARRTVRVVCEGDAEVNFIRHVRRLYLADHIGHAVSHRNARGKGGRRALELALSRQSRSGVDEMAILIDTDTDWGAEQLLKARQHRVQVLESMPFLEAWLLQVAGHDAPGNTAACKREFRQRFGGEAHSDWTCRGVA